MSSAYWFIYDKKNLDSEDNLYAYTYEKKIIKKFKKQRNMEMFMIVRKELTRNQVNDLYKRYRELILVDVELKTRGFQKKVAKVSLVITMKEKFIVESRHNRYVFMPHSIIDDPFNINIFKYEYVEALKSCLYKYFSMITTGDILIADDESTVVVDDLQIYLEICHTNWYVYESFLSLPERT